MCDSDSRRPRLRATGYRLQVGARRRTPVHAACRSGSARQTPSAGKARPTCPEPGARRLSDGFRRVAPALLVVALALAVGLTGCVRRTLRITTEPPNALVFLNDQEIGRSAVSTDFIWYGDYDLIIRKEGYKTLKTHWEVKPPWYQIMPIDFFAEVLWPGQIHDIHTRHLVLEPAEAPAREELIERAMETQRQALSPPK